MSPRSADEVVVNLVPPERVRAVRATIDADAAAAGRTAPRLAVWLAAALDPGATHAQLASQLAAYLAPPGYGDMFSELGFADLVQRARDGAPRAELARSIPDELLEHVCALGSREALAERISAYFDAGADIVGVVPSTAEDPAGRGVLTALSETFQRPVNEAAEAPTAPAP